MLRTTTLTALGLLGALAAGPAFAQGQDCVMRTQAVDLDGNGWITQDEAMQARTQSYGQVDLNGDGQISSDEFMACYGAPSNQVLMSQSNGITAPNGGSGSTMSDSQVAAWKSRSADQFTGMDTNGDQLLSQDEFMGGYQRDWASMPANDQGAVAANDYMQFYNTLPSIQENGVGDINQNAGTNDPDSGGSDQGSGGSDQGSGND